MNLSGKKATLNPNATEFVPFALRAQTSVISISDASSKFSSPGPPGKKSILDRSESSISKDSDEEAHQYWRNQLPDDITPDFDFTGFESPQEINSLSFSSLSLTDIDQQSRFTSSASSGFIPKQQGLSPLAKPWKKQIVDNNSYNGISGIDFLDDMSNEQLLMDDEDVSPLEFLASQFPDFAAESLTEVYFACGSDLNLTIEMLTQLELQVEFDGGLNQTLHSKSLPTPNHSASDFPALSMTNSQNGMAKFGGDDHQSVGSFRSPEKERSFLFRSFSDIPSRGATDFASAVRKTVPQEPSIWKFDKKCSSGTNIGSSKSSQVIGSSYNSVQGRGIFGNLVQNKGPARASPVWLETGEAVANMYSEMREEARGHALIRNAYFEQARQAYMIGNKALAKDLSIKGQMHNMQMKEAQESIYHQRNTMDMQANGRERMIDLHGLHVSEVFHVLKRELAVFRNAARSADQHMLVYICIGTGHHTRGSRTPSRLSTAVQRYLLEEEGLNFTEPQPGLLKVVIF